MDHINGIHNDHRIENLRLLCPNCHSQTKTFAGRRHKKPIKRCKQCGNNLHRQNRTGLCIKCNNRLSGFDRRRVEWPSKKALKKMIE